MTRNGYKTDLHLCWSGKNSIRLKKEARESDGKWGMFQRVWGGRWEVEGIHFRALFRVHTACMSFVCVSPL